MNNQKKSNLFLALLPIIFLILMSLASAVKWKFGMNVPLIFSIIVSCFVGKYIGIYWNDMGKALKKGVSRVMPAVFILIIVGTIIGWFIVSGIILTLTYYGLTMITPRLFIPSAALVTAIIATATGTSFNSIATIGLALMVVGNTMGFPSHIVAGAVLSGAYFGDKISPLSDTTTIASSMSGCNIFEHVFHMITSALISLFASIVIYYFIGINFISSVNINWSTIEQLSNGLSANFNINSVLILVPWVSVIFALKKIPTIPSLLAISLISSIFAVIFQGIHITKLFKIATFGYESNTGIKMLDSLLSRGGINYNKKGLNQLIDMITNSEVDKVVILYKDRLIRFGFELIENLCNKYGTAIEIIDNTEKTEEQELVEDLIQIVTVFSYKLNGKKLSVTELGKELTILKNAEGYEWLYEVSNATLKESIRDLNKAYKNFFNGRVWVLSVGIEIQAENTTLNDFSLGIDLGIKELAVTNIDSLDTKNINKTNKVKKLSKKLKRLQRQCWRKYIMNKKEGVTKRLRTLQKSN